MQKTLTDSLIQSLAAPPAGRTEIADARCIGLSIRVTPNGIKSWSFRFRARGGGGVSRVTLGTYPALGLSKARAQANAARSTVATGGDPAAQRREQRGGGKTFATLADRYLTEHARRHKRSHAADERNLRKHVLPKWRNRAYASIRRGDVIELVESLVLVGKPTLANRVQALISTVFSFGIDAGLTDSNPCHRLKKRGVEKVGQRVLSDAELRLFWAGVVESPDARRTGLGLRLTLLTGARVGEIAGLSRAELQNVDSAAGAAWLIPGARTKNGRDLLLPLAPLARATVLELLAMIEPGEPYLFPTRSKRRTGPMRPNSLTQAMANFGGRVSVSSARKPHADDPAATWTAEPPSPHDLRRTVETRLAGLGVAKEHRDRVLNHIQGDVGSRHYDRHDYAAEKRAALGRWGDALGKILRMPSGGASIVPLAARAVRGM